MTDQLRVASPLVAGCLALAALPATVCAQGTIVVSVPEGVPVSQVHLGNEGQVSIATNGAVSASCIDSDSDGRCDAFPGQTVAAPQIGGFTLTAVVPPGGSRPRVEVGQSFFATWSTTQADLCLASGSSGLAGWSGVLPISGAGQPATGMSFNAATSLSSPGRVSLACYGHGGVAQRDVLVDVIEASTNPPPPPPVGCAPGPLIAPTQWVNSGITWSGLGGNPTYPPNQSTRTVVLGQYAYITLPFVPTAGSNMMISLASNQFTLDPTWEGMFVGVSECAADFRFGMVTPPVAEPTLSRACRRTVQGPEIGFRVFGTTAGGEGECVLTPGRTYYLNIIQAGSESGIINRQSDCPGERCGFQIKF